MAKEKQKIDYSNLGETAYDGLLNRENDLSYQFGRQDSGGRQGKAFGSGNDDGTTQTEGGSVATVSVKNEGNAGDVWIRNFIRSVNWKPKTVGFYINGLTGYAEFTNVFISGEVTAIGGTLGGFVVGTNFIRDVANTMGLSSVITGGDDVRFWAGDTFANKSIAPFRVYESGKIFSENVDISGGTITGTVVGASSGVGPPTGVPPGIGVLYIDIDPAPITDRTYISIGIATESDWLVLNSHGITRIISVFDSLTISENFTPGTTSNPNVFSLINVTENVVVSTAAFAISVFETMTLTEDVTLSVF